MYSPRLAASERIDSPSCNNSNKKDLGPRPTTYGGCEERGRNRARERLQFSSKEEEENEKNSAYTKQDKHNRKDDKENFAVPLTPGIKTPKPRGVKTPYQQLMVPPSKPRSPLMARQLIPSSLDDTCTCKSFVFFFFYQICILNFQYKIWFMFWFVDVLSISWRKSNTPFFSPNINRIATKQKNVIYFVQIHVN